MFDKNHVITKQNAYKIGSIDRNLVGNELNFLLNNLLPHLNYPHDGIHRSNFNLC